MRILGLNAFHADASAALLIDGELVVAIEEERLTRIKHCAGFPAEAARACLRIAKVRPEELDHVAVSRNPRANLVRKLRYALKGNIPTRLLGSRLANAARFRGIEAQLAQALSVEKLRARFHAVEHHRAHLASAFFASSFEEAAVLSIDGFGDFVSTMWARGNDRKLQVLGSVGYPHSLGTFYTATTQWLGFPHYGDEGKVMGLAPYGQPRFVDVLRQACHPTDEGFALDVDWFLHTTRGARMTWEEGAPSLERLFSDRYNDALGKARQPGEPLAALHHDVAASLQAVTEEIVIHLARLVYKQTQLPRLCLAGGVALNSVANGKLRSQTPFSEIFVQPAAGDNGTSLGAALYVEHQVLRRPRHFVMEHAYTGPAYDRNACAQAIAKVELRATAVEDQTALVERTAQALVDGKVVGWFQGAMEFGPRALGNRSVLCDPRKMEMKDRLNRRIKRREAFRPFAPAILAERVDAWFADAQPSPAMLMVLPFLAEQRDRVPAVVHVDGSGRLQTVERKTNPLFHALISAFEKKTQIPILLNTSFNENEPIVCTPEEAVACFMRTELDILVLGDFWIER